MLGPRYGRPEPLLQQLKAYPPTSATPLILCTADATVLWEREDFLRKAGVQTVLKPFNINVLLQTIRQALQQQGAFKETAPDMEKQRSAPPTAVKRGNTDE
ncbi:MAG TPA: hypothetical protein VFN35_07750 [Ktedonobacteraceae bacterium]|nr:hypothetical protein [Ktedonobacteraceae bacterium]